MLLYNIRIALQEPEAEPVLSAVIIGGIALGIAVSTMFSTIRHAFAKDPIPSKSDVLHYVRLDSWDPLRAVLPATSPRIPPTQITYRDMVELMKSTSRCARAGCSRRTSLLFPEQEHRPPAQAARADVLRRLLPHVRRAVQVRVGLGPKGRRGAEPVVVLDEEKNDKLFGGQNSVGQDRPHRGPRVQGGGRARHWRPSVKFYDLTQQFIAAAREGLHARSTSCRPMQIRTAGNSDGWKSRAGAGLRGAPRVRDVLDPDVGRAAHRDEAPGVQGLPDRLRHGAEEGGALRAPPQQPRDAAHGWMTEQRRRPGRDHRHGGRLAPVPRRLRAEPDGAAARRSSSPARPRSGVRRALGARRLRHLHAAHRGVRDRRRHRRRCSASCSPWAASPILNKLDASPHAGPRRSVPDRPAHDGSSRSALSLLAGLIAGAYPAWRVCRIPPAIHLKVQ